MESEIEMPTDPQIRERMNSGDIHGAVRLAAREKIANLKKAQRSEREMQLAALEELVRRYPEINTEFMGGQLRLSLAELGLKGTTIEDMEAALAHVQETLAPVAEYEEARRQAAAEPITTARQSQSERRAERRAAAVPVAEPEDSPLDLQAKELIRSGKVSVDSVRAMSSTELGRMISQYPAFERARELLPRPAPSLLTRGELVAASGLAHVKNQQGETVLTSDIVEAVEKSKRDFWTSLNQEPPAPSMPPSTPRGIVNLNRAMYLPNKRQPTMKEALAWEKKDADAVEEMRRKSARAIRVKAHRGKA
jgi:hypothetical protein